MCSFHCFFKSRDFFVATSKFQFYVDLFSFEIQLLPSNYNVFFVVYELEEVCLYGDKFVPMLLEAENMFQKIKSEKTKQWKNIENDLKEII